jgi:hypothetical protein
LSVPVKVNVNDEDNVTALLANAAPEPSAAEVIEVSGGAVSAGGAGAAMVHE